MLALASQGDSKFSKAD